MQIKNDNQFASELDAYIKNHIPVSCDTIVKAMRDLGYDCSPRMVRPRLREMGLHVKNVHKEWLWGHWDDAGCETAVLPVVAERPANPSSTPSTETQKHQVENELMTQERNALWRALQKTVELKKEIKSAQERLLVELADLIHSTYGQTSSASTASPRESESKTEAD